MGRRGPVHTARLEPVERMRSVHGDGQITKVEDMAARPMDAEERSRPLARPDAEEGIGDRPLLVAPDFLADRILTLVGDADAIS